LSNSGGERVCPICDSPLQPGSKKCGICGTDLTIFEMDFEAPKQQAKPSAPPPPSPPPSRPSMEARMEEIFSKPLVEPSRPSEKPAPPPSAAPSRPPAPAPPRPEPVKQEPVETPARAPKAEAPVAEAPPAVPKAESEHYFECPECGSRVPEDARTCPGCGVMFADEETEFFPCPACNTSVKMDATSCPGCGAQFVEADAAPVAEAPAEKPEPPAAPEAPTVQAEAQPEPEMAEEPRKKGLFGWLSRERKAQRADEAGPVTGPSFERIGSEPARPSGVGIREARPPPEAPSAPRAAEAARPDISAMEPKDKGKELARMVAEMKQLLSLARDREIDIGESKMLIDEAAAAGRERDLDTAIGLVQKSRAVLMGKIDSDIEGMIGRLSEEAKVAGELGGDVSRAKTYIQEAGKASSARDVEAAYVYTDKAVRELQPITGRYNDTRNKLEALKQLISDSEAFFVDTKEARNILIESSRAFEMRDFDRADSLVRDAKDVVHKAIPSRMNEEIRRARDQLAEAKAKGVNITPMITVLKSAARMLKAADYSQALREMREFKDMMRKV
jgi:hypothetical protein